MRAVTTGTAALTQVAPEKPALIILDLMLPDIDGIEICRRVRKTSDVPILMLTPATRTSTRSSGSRSAQTTIRRSCSIRVSSWPA